MLERWFSCEKHRLATKTRKVHILAYSVLTFSNEVLVFTASFWCFGCSDFFFFIKYAKYTQHKICSTNQAFLPSSKHTHCVVWSSLLTKILSLLNNRSVAPAPTIPLSMNPISYSSLTSRIIKQLFFLDHLIYLMSPSFTHYVTSIRMVFLLDQRLRVLSCVD